MLEENLSKLGFSPSEVQVYLLLARNGASYPSKISFQTGLNRTNVYEALDRLVSKGVVSFVTKNKVKFFEVKDPFALKEIVLQKEEEFSKTKKELLAELHELSKKNRKTASLEASIFVGKNGLRILLEEMLKEKKPISLLASQYQLKFILEHYFEQWHKKRIFKKIFQRSIFPKKFKKIVKKRKYLSFKFVDDKYTSPTSTFVYGDTCVFVQWADPILAIKVQNKEITKSHLNYFNLLWNLA